MRNRLAALTLLLAVGWAGAAPLQDPMRPPGQVQHTPNNAPMTMELTSVVIGRDRRIAVINGERLTTGSQIGPAEVVAITPSQVTLRRGGKLVALPLLDLKVKAISKAREE